MACEAQHDMIRTYKIPATFSLDFLFALYCDPNYTGTSLTTKKPSFALRTSLSDRDKRYADAKHILKGAR